MWRIIIIHSGYVKTMCLDIRVIFFSFSCCSYVLMECLIQGFSLTAPDASFSTNLHHNFTSAAALIATPRPCRQPELLHVWNPELWNPPFWPPPLILLSVPTLSCPWNMFFGLIGTLGLLTSPYVSSPSLPPTSIPSPALFVQPLQLYSHKHSVLSLLWLFVLSFIPVSG